jgi:hypothetical protein
VNPAFNKILQISVVVPDTKAYAKRYNDLYGIGPWKFMSFNDETTTNMEVNGKPVKYSMLLGLCDFFDNVQLELIEPLDDLSIYSDFLKKNGPGLHHIACATGDSFHNTIDGLAKRDIKVVQSGRDAGGMDFAYVDLMSELGIIVELYNPPPDFVMPAPDSTYP